MSTNGSQESRSAASRGRPGAGLLGLLRPVALVTVVAGAAGSVALMLRVGHRNDSRILLGLFTIWVLSPFVALVLADIISTRWSVLTRTTLHSVMLILTLGSLAIYGDVALGPPRSKPAFMFLAVPLGSWLLMAVAVPIAAFVSGWRSRRGAGA
jgi:hypothetical protein